MRTRATLAAASLAVGVLALGTPAASASQSTTADSLTASAAQSATADSDALRKGCREHWVLRGNHTDLGEACYKRKHKHEKHWAHVDDQEGNDQSVVLVISKKGENGYVDCWDYKGHEGHGKHCTVTRWGNGDHVRGRLCPGEHGDMDIHWKQCTKFKKFKM